MSGYNNGHWNLSYVNREVSKGGCVEELLKSVCSIVLQVELNLKTFLAG